MSRVLLLVEGQTEEAFVNLVLRPHLDSYGVFPTASLLRTRELPAGSPHSGGVTTYGRMLRDARRLLADTNARVTTIIDMYGLPADFPAAAATTSVSPPARVAQLEAAFAADVAHPRFHPFIALHEFEAWIFAVPDVAEDHLAIRGLGDRIADIAASAGGPENINEGRDTHPARRLIDLAGQSGRRGYGKVGDGPDILAKAGLAPLRAACPHFAQWLGWLEGLGASRSVQRA